jgi:hypothetical protein
MNDHDLTQLLERLADRTPVGPPPINEMRASAGRTRRRRAVWIAGAAAAAVLAVVGSSLALARFLPTDNADHGVSLAPTGTRFVGRGRIAVAVPEGWGTNDRRCGTPRVDSVVVDPGLTLNCWVPWPVGVESVYIHQSEGNARGGRIAFDVHGVRAERSATRCVDQGQGQRPIKVCSISVDFPEDEVSLEFTSATSRAKVEEMLGWIHIVHGLMPVPSDQEANNAGIQADATLSPVDFYRKALATRGLQAKFVEVPGPKESEGDIAALTPDVGTMVPRGSTVKVAVVVPAAASTPPDGTRFVGMGRIAVAVPDDWETNLYNCLGARDNVSFGEVAVAGCMPQMPQGIEKIAVTPDDLPSTDGFTLVSIEGVAALRSPVRIAGETAPERHPLWSRDVVFPQDDLTITFSSGTSPEVLEEMLDRIHIVHGLSTVPTYVPTYAEIQANPGAPERAAAYRRELERNGFVVNVVQVNRPGMPAGQIASVSPEIGTMVLPGSKVTVQVVNPG